MKTRIVYLLHFTKPLIQVRRGKRVEIRHYIGSAIDLRKRLNKHWTGHGSALTKEFYRKKIPFVLSTFWVGDRQLERKIKNRKQARHYCMVCQGLHDGL